MKRDNHITVNLSDEQYNMLCFIATNQRRKLAEMAYLILIDEVERLTIQLSDIKNTGFNKLKR